MRTGQRVGRWVRGQFIDGLYLYLQWGRVVGIPQRGHCLVRWPKRIRPQAMLWEAVITRTQARGLKPVRLTSGGAS